MDISALNFPNGIRWNSINVYIAGTSEPPFFECACYLKGRPSFLIYFFLHTGREVRMRYAYLDPASRLCRTPWLQRTLQRQNALSHVYRLNSPPNVWGTSSPKVLPWILTRIFFFGTLACDCRMYVTIFSAADLKPLTWKRIFQNLFNLKNTK